MDNRDVSLPESDDLGDVENKVNAFASINALSAKPSPRAAPEIEQEKRYDDARKAEEKHRGRQFKNDRLQQDMQLREKHAEKAVGLAQAAVGTWIFMFALAGSVNLMQGRAFLSDQGLITLTAGATVNVIAVFLVVVKGLFPSHPSAGKRRKTIGKSGAGKKNRSHRDSE